MKKTLIVSLIACIILIGSSLALGQEDFIELVKTGSLEEVKGQLKPERMLMLGINGA